MESRDSMVVDGKELSDRTVESARSMPTPKPAATSDAKLLSRPKSAPRSLKQHLQPPPATSCTCGFVETQQEKEEGLKRARIEAKMRSLERLRKRQVGNETEQESLHGNGIILRVVFQTDKAQRELFRPARSSITFSGQTPPVNRSASLPNVSQVALPLLHICVHFLQFTLESFDVILATLQREGAASDVTGGGR